MTLGGRELCSSLALPSGMVDPWINGNGIVAAAGEVLALVLSVDGKSVAVNFSIALRA